MRDFKGMKRQRGRNRGGGSGGGGGKPQHNANRAFESNGPDNVKVRGAAQSIFERYQQLARDASSAGDRVLAENYLQHAEHYFRTIRAMQPQRPVSEILGRDAVSSGFDIDFEAEPEEGAEHIEQTSDEGGDGEGQQRDDRQREGQQRDGQQRDRYDNNQGRQRDDRPQGGQQRDRYENRDRPRDDRPRDERQRDDRPQGGQRDDRQRDDRPQGGQQRDDRPRDDRPQGQQRDDRQQGEGRRDRWRERDNRDREPREQVAAEPAPVETPVNSLMLRSEDGEVSHAPAFLGRAAEPRTDTEAAAAAPKPRRPRAPRKPAAEEV